MFRIITTKRLEQLQALVADLRADNARGLAIVTEARVRLGLLEESRDYFKKLAETWERRACRFIDQVGIKSDTIAAPAMSDPVPPPQSGSRQVMAALGVTEINKRTSPPSSQATQVDGVDEDAAREAVSFVRK